MTGVCHSPEHSILHFPAILWDGLRRPRLSDVRAASAMEKAPASERRSDAGKAEALRSSRVKFGPLLTQSSPSEPLTKALFQGFLLHLVRGPCSLKPALAGLPLVRLIRA